jgi:hypothetical protein
VDSPFFVLYRWRLHPDREEAFVAAWSRLTVRLRAERGALGSRLHRGADGLWYAYAAWPNASARAASTALGSVDGEASKAMRDAIAEVLPEVPLEVVADYLGSMPPTRSDTFG